MVLMVLLLSVPPLMTNRKRTHCLPVANINVFAWQPFDIPGVPTEVIENHLVVCPHARPVKQKVWKQAFERQQFIA